MTRLLVRRRATGFTLVELLGVIIIIAILAAVIFPAIQAAIRKSQSSASAQNLRQWGLAQLQFIADHGHYCGLATKFVHVSDDKKSHNARWFNDLSPYMQASKEATTNKGGITATDAAGVTTTASGGEGIGDKDQSVYSSVFKDPLVSSWLVGRNNSYGYNYQYLGNNRARSGYGVGGVATAYLDTDADSKSADEKLGFVHFPVVQTQIERPDLTIMFAESDGTGIGPYVDQFGGNDISRIGNHGYSLDPSFLPLRNCDQDSLADDRPGVSNSTGSGTSNITDRAYFDYAAATAGATGPAGTAAGDGGAGSWDDQLVATGPPWDNNAARSVITNRHNGGANICFADGHVEWKLREECYWDESGRKSNRLWNGYGRDNKDEIGWKDRSPATPGTTAYTAGLTSLEAGEIIDPNEEVFVHPTTGAVVYHGDYALGTGTGALTKTAAATVVLGLRPKVPPLSGSFYKEGVGKGGS